MIIKEWYQVRINEQIKVLNEGFGGKHHDEGVDSKIKFKLKYIKYVNDKKLYESCGKSENKIINSYQETQKYISVYVCNDDFLFDMYTLGMKRKVIGNKLFL